VLVDSTLTAGAAAPQNAAVNKKTPRSQPFLSMDKCVEKKRGEPGARGKGRERDRA